MHDGREAVNIRRCSHYHFHQVAKTETKEERKHFLSKVIRHPCVCVSLGRVNSESLVQQRVFQPN